MRIVWSPTAIRHLAEIRRYIDRHNPQAAGNTAAAVRRAVSVLRDFPGLGRAGRVPETREQVVSGTPYIVPYTVRGDVIEIHAVLHGARKWPEHFD